MKYKITENNIKWDSTYRNTMYFETISDRDTFIETNVQSNWKEELENAPQTFGVTMSPSGATVEIEWKGSYDELFSKNTIILKEDKNTEPKFYFINNITQMDNNNMFELELTPNLFLNYPGVMEGVSNMEMIEGHVNDASILDMVLDGGYRTPYKITPLERNFDWAGTFPNKDINTLNNQWIYAMIKTPNNNDIGRQLFRYNNQRLPYRVLIAPWNDIIIQDANSLGNTIAQVNKTWENLTFEGITSSGISAINDSYLAEVTGNEIGVTDLFENDQVVFLQSEPIEEQGEVRVGLTFNGVDTFVRIPYDKFITTYKDNWELIIVSDNQSIIDEEQALIVSGKDTTTKNYSNTSFLEMKWDSLNNSIRFRAPNINDTEELYKKVKFNINAYHFKRTKDGGLVNSTINDEDVFVNILNEEQDVRYNDKIVHPGWSYGIDATTTYTIQSSGKRYTYKLYYTEKSFKVTIRNVFQGDPSAETLIWSKQPLIEFINSQANPTGENNTAEIIDVKVSSFNPLSFDGSGNINNIKIKDADNTNINWDGTEVIELFEMYSENADLLNSYDLTKFKDKSWIKGMENYSIMIENNKTFEIKPEKVYGIKPMIHKLIPMPSEWTERIVFDTDIHNEGYEFVNDKEMLFATNAFNEYQANNPGALKNQQFNNNIQSLKALTQLGIGIGSGGVGAIAGAGSVGNNLVERRNYKQNITMMKEQPVHSSGTGSAYGDLFLNNNGFGLTLVEWIYTTPQALSVINNITRNGLSYTGSIIVNFESIKRPQFNYIKINNGTEVMDNTKLSPNVIQQFNELFLAGVRMWYDYDNFLDYEIENDSIITTNSINYVDFNNLKQNKTI